MDVTKVQEDGSGQAPPLVPCDSCADDPIAGDEPSAKRVQLLRAMVENSSDIMTVLDPGGCIVYSSPAATRVLGYGQGELDGQSAFALVHPDDVERVLTTFIGSVDQRGLTDAQEFRMRHADGSWRTVEAIGNNLLHDPVVNGFVISTRDVTERVAMEEALRDSEDRYRRLVEHSPEAIAVHQDGIFVYANPACLALLGAEHEAELIGRSIVEVVHPDDVAALVSHGRMLAETHHVPLREQRLVRLDGKVIDVEAVAVAITFRGAMAAQVMARDISGRKQAEAELAHQALHDHLTGLPNRTLLLDRLGQALGRAARTDVAVAVLFLDLDRFKIVNDSLGHDAGDRLLVLVTQRLRNVLRETDTLARFGGDEFVIVVDEVQDINEVTALAERIAAALDQPVSEGDHEVRVQTSIGIAVTQATPTDDVPEDLIRDADAAMYRAKDRGRARYEIFDSAMRSRAIGRLQHESALRQALDQGELRVFYQPLVSVLEPVVVGMEALVRWQHPERGLLLPGDFIPVAEESGLIVPIGAWVFAEACAQAAVWDALGRPLEVAVNLSARQLGEPNLVKSIAHMLHATDIPHGHMSLCLEITESLAMEDPVATTAILEELKGLGVGLAIDDFGTGYSSLAHLRRFPVDTLKIDRSFISGLDQDRDSQAIVAAIIDVGHALDLDVVAEGVETAAELDVLRQLECDRAQGFWFARPQPPAEVSKVLMEGFPHLA